MISFIESIGFRVSVATGYREHWRIVALSVVVALTPTLARAQTFDPEDRIEVVDGFLQAASTMLGGVAQLIDDLDYIKGSDLLWEENPRLGVPWVEALGTAALVSEVGTALRAGEYGDASLALTKHIALQAFTSDPRAMRLLSFDAYSRLAALPVEFGLRAFVRAVDSKGFENQLKAYRIARDDFGISHESILAGKEVTNKGTVYFGRNGVISELLGDMSGRTETAIIVPSFGRTPISDIGDTRTMFEFIRAIYEAEKSRAAETRALSDLAADLREMVAQERDRDPGGSDEARSGQVEVTGDGGPRLDDVALIAEAEPVSETQSEDGLAGASTVSSASSDQDWFGRGMFEPGRDTDLRAGILRALRPRVEVSFGAPVEFMVDEMRVADDRAYVRAFAQRPGGSAIEIESTPHYRENGPSFSEDYRVVSAILRYVEGRWVGEPVIFGASEAYWLEDCPVLADLMPETCATEVAAPAETVPETRAAVVSAPPAGGTGGGGSPRVWTEAIVDRSGASPTACGTDISESCLRSTLGLSEDAVSFVLEYHAMEIGPPAIPFEFRELGRLDLVTAETGLSSGPLELLVNGTPSIQYPRFPSQNIGELPQDRAVVTTRSARPSASGWGGIVLGKRVLGDGTTRITTGRYFTTECRACAVVGLAVGFSKFDAEGRFAGYTDVGFLAADDFAGDFPTPDLLRSRGAVVQFLLNQSGYEAGAMDGRPGPMTRAALEEFQADQCLPVTGEMDASTAAALIAADPFGAPCEGAAPERDPDALGAFRVPDGYTWIQTHSRASYAEAAAEARLLGLPHGSVRVFEAANGWFAVATGPDRILDGDPDRHLSDRISWLSLPDDSLLTSGAGFVAELAVEEARGVPAPAFIRSRTIRPTRVSLVHEPETFLDLPAGEEVVVFAGDPVSCSVDGYEPATIPCADLGLREAGYADGTLKRSVGEEGPETASAGDRDAAYGGEPVPGPWRQQAEPDLMLEAGESWEGFAFPPGRPVTFKEQPLFGNSSLSDPLPGEELWVFRDSVKRRAIAMLGSMSIGGARQIALVDLTLGEVLQGETRPLTDYGPDAVSWSPDERYASLTMPLASEFSQGLGLIDLESGRFVLLPADRSPSSGAIRVDRSSLQTETGGDVLASTTSLDTTGTAGPAEAPGEVLRISPSELFGTRSADGRPGSADVEATPRRAQAEAPATGRGDQIITFSKEAPAQSGGMTATVAVRYSGDVPAAVILTPDGLTGTASVPASRTPTNAVASAPSEALGQLDRASALAMLRAQVSGAVYVAHPGTRTMRVREQDLPAFRQAMVTAIFSDDREIRAAQIEGLAPIAERTPLDLTFVDQLRFARDNGQEIIGLWQSGTASLPTQVWPIMTVGVPQQHPSLDPQGFVVGDLGVKEVSGIFVTGVTAEAEFSMGSSGAAMATLAEAERLDLRTFGLLDVPTGVERREQLIRSDEFERTWTAIFRLYDDGWRLWEIR